MLAITPLEAWIRTKIAGPRAALADALAAYQLQGLNDVVDYARERTRFYRGHLAAVAPAPLSGLADIVRLPFTTAEDLARDPAGFVAVGQDDIARIVTLRTSGSTGEAKRLYFTETDLELTVDFFHHGMSTLVRPGQRVAILLPGATPDSVGDLLARGLRRMAVEAVAFGPVADPLKTAQDIAAFAPQCVVGIPTQVLAVAGCGRGAALDRGIETVLLSTDYVPGAIARRLEAAWGCRVFTHYGMTEMGLGGGVECEALDGYHLREADLYFEVVDPWSGQPCADGTLGEVVFTTLTRRGMPLIRYRTGDIARILPLPCPCGSALRRMERVGGRWNGAVTLGPGCTLTMAAMDEALFGLANLLDYQAAISRVEGGKFRLRIDVHGTAGDGPTAPDVAASLGQIEAIGTALARDYLEPAEVRLSPDGRWSTTGVAKRIIRR